ncbi:MFS transporter [Micromonospora auratinigra]|uniref:Drug resistance transporter, EmrB/QacA subfamily n=1 Tax=Micromonospora auratinigra TaxID=261654 RepID=A0A1A8ZFU5_9ACTN|nr:MFS transporter [Micromonospora auratinigra]SBT42741.1 drug resistance transporter, EmrB/QacA subfamily [Micromonospora auratinigra]
MSHPAPAGPDQATLPLTPRGTRLTLLALMLAVLFASTDLMVVNIAMYSIIKEFDPGHGVDDSRWILTVYTLALAVSQPLYGKLADLIGGKRIMVFAMSLFLTGSLACGLSQGMGQLIVFRGVQGLGAGGLLSVATVLAAQIAAPRNRAKYAGYAGGLALVGFVIGPVVGGFFTDAHHLLGVTVDWRWAFFLNIPVGVAVVAVLLVALPNMATRPGIRIDWLGALLMVGGIGALLLVLELGGDTYHWLSGAIAVLVAVGAVLLTAFFLQERRADEPILPPRLYRDQAFRVAVPLSVIAGFAMMGVSYYVALYLRLVRELDAMDTCLHMIPLLVGMLVGLLFTGILIADHGRYKIFPIVGAAVAATGAGLCATVGPDTSSWLISLYLLLFGLGIGQLTQVPLATVQNSVPEDDLGTATTAVVFVRMVGQSLGPAIFGAILNVVYAASLPSWIPADTGASAGAVADSTVTRSLPPEVQHAMGHAFVRGLHGVFLVGAAALVIAFLVAFRYREQPIRDRAGVPAGEPATADGVA